MGWLDIAIGRRWAGRGRARCRSWLLGGGARHGLQSPERPVAIRHLAIRLTNEGNSDVIFVDDAPIERRSAGQLTAI